MNIISPDPNTLIFESYIKQLRKILSKAGDVIGFVPVAVLRESAKKKTLLLLEKNDNIVGFCNFTIRKRDNVGVIYEIFILPFLRKKGYGLQIIKKILEKCDEIQLKCPINLISNNFYNKIGKKIDVQKGKKIDLNIYRITKSTIGDSNE